MLPVKFPPGTPYLKNKGGPQMTTEYQNIDGKSELKHSSMSRPNSSHWKFLASKQIYIYIWNGYPAAGPPAKLAAKKDLSVEGAQLNGRSSLCTRRNLLEGKSIPGHPLLAQVLNWVVGSIVDRIFENSSIGLCGKPSAATISNSQIRSKSDKLRAIVCHGEKC